MKLNMYNRSASHFCRICNMVICQEENGTFIKAVVKKKVTVMGKCQERNAFCVVFRHSELTVHYSLKYNPSARFSPPSCL